MQKLTIREEFHGFTFSMRRKIDKLFATPVLQKVKVAPEIKTMERAELSVDYHIAIGCSPLFADCAPTLLRPHRGGQWQAHPTTNIRGCLGGQVLDFREASLPEALDIHVCIICGAVSLFFPSTVHVNVKSIAVSSCSRDTLWRGKNGLAGELAVDTTVRLDGTDYQVQYVSPKGQLDLKSHDGKVGRYGVHPAAVTLLNAPAGITKATVSGYSCCAATGIAVLEPGDRAPAHLIYGDNRF